MDNSNITPEFKEKAKGKTADELLSLAQEEGIELTDEQLERVSGGWSTYRCHYCGSLDSDVIDDEYYTFICLECGRKFN